MNKRNKTIGEVALVTMGLSPSGKSYNYARSGLPLLNGPTEFGTFSPNCTLYTIDSKRECKKEDLIFCVRGNTTGRMNWADTKYSLGRGVCSIRGQTRIDTKYIRYCLSNYLPEMLQMAGGSTMPNLRESVIKQFQIPYPSCRHKITAVLSAYDNLIENNLRRIEILEEMAQALYREWFVHFRFPGHEEAQFVDSPLGKIPEGWGVHELKEFITIDKGISYKGKYLTEEGTPMVNLKCVQPGGGFNRNGVKPYAGDYRPRHRVVPGDLFFANTDLTQAGKVIGSPAIVPKTGFNEGGIASHHICIVRFRSHNPLSVIFLFHLMRDGGFTEFAKGCASGTTVLGFRPDDALSFEFILPSQSIIHIFEDIALGIYELSENLRDKNALLQNTRDHLLPKLISGELDVSDLDIDVSKVN